MPPDHSAFAALEKRQWSDASIARNYADGFAEAADMVAPVLAGSVSPGPGKRVLDLCCGHGNVSASLVASGADVIGVDFSPTMLDLARAAVPDASFVEGDAMALPFEAGTFDAVTIGFGMPHVPDPEGTLSEARRVLRPGGRIAFSVWCGPEVEGAMGYVFGAIARHGDPDVALPPGPGATDYADPAIAFPALERSGFLGMDRTLVQSGWQVDDPARPYELFRDGTARGGALLLPQPEDRAHAIREAVVAEVIARHGEGPSWHVPLPAVVISATAV